MTGCLTIAGLLSTCLAMTAATAQDRAPDYAAVVAAPDRTEADVQTDKRRDPVKLLAFTGAHPGMKVLDMGAGGGYSTELMARAVAPSGVVYGQNPADIGERAKTRFEARLNTPGGKNIVSLARPFDDPLPADVRDLDLITFLFFYHDTTYMPVERAEMNRKLYAALKPGGMLVIADHSAKPGAGTSVGKSLHLPVDWVQAGTCVGCADVAMAFHGKAKPLLRRCAIGACPGILDSRDAPAVWRYDAE